MSDFRIALVVPNVRKHAEQSSAPVPSELIKRALKLCDADLVVFPENFRSCKNRSGVVNEVRQLAEALDKPVTAGVWCEDESMQCAAFWNPSPTRSETREHFYAKHATSVRLAYELDGYEKLRETMFDPIRIKDRRLALLLCHDMFFGLTAARWRRNGADTMVDMTGNNINLSKWTNVIAARSLEHDVPFLCTMSNWTFLKTSNVAEPIAFSNGRPLEVAASAEGPRGKVQVFDLAKLDGETREQSFTDKVYSEIRVALGKQSSKAHVSVLDDGSCSISTSTDGWGETSTDVGRLGVLVRPLAELRDPLLLHRLERTPSFEHQLVVFVGADELAFNDAMTLAKIRAIEHRTAIGLLTPTYREVMKTNRYKNIQRIPETDGLFGLDGMFMDGTYAHAPEESVHGLPSRFTPAYRSLMQLAPTPARQAAKRQPRPKPKPRPRVRQSLVDRLADKVAAFMRRV